MTRSRISNVAEDEWRRKDPNFREPFLTQNLDFVDILRRVEARHNVGAAQVAIAWTLLNPAVTGAIVGVQTVAQARDIAGTDIRLKEDAAKSEHGTRRRRLEVNSDNPP